MWRILRICTALVVILTILYGVLSVRVYRVTGDSMNHFLLDGQLVFIDRISTRFSPLQRGEVVVYRDMAENSMIKIKRIVGLSGETIKIADGKVMLAHGSTETELTERYLEVHVHTCIPGSCTDLSPHIFDVPPGSYFVLGDNRSNSRDSRGCTDVADCQNQKPVYIPGREILGRAFFSW